MNHFSILYHFIFCLLFSLIFFSSLFFNLVRVHVHDIIKFWWQIKELIWSLAGNYQSRSTMHINEPHPKEKKKKKIEKRKWEWGKMKMLPSCTANILHYKPSLFISPYLDSLWGEIFRSAMYLIFLTDQRKPISDPSHRRDKNPRHHGLFPLLVTSHSKTCTFSLHFLFSCCFPL